MEFGLLPADTVPTLCKAPVAALIVKASAWPPEPCVATYTKRETLEAGGGVDPFSPALLLPFAGGGIDEPSLPPPPHAASIVKTSRAHPISPDLLFMVLSPSPPQAGKPNLFGIALCRCRCDSPEGSSLDAVAIYELACWNRLGNLLEG